MASPAASAIDMRAADQAAAETHKKAGTPVASADCGTTSPSPAAPGAAAPEVDTPAAGEAAAGTREEAGGPAAPADPPRKPSGVDHAGILATLETWLQTPMGAAACSKSTGFVPICDAISMCADLRRLSGGALAPVASAVRGCSPGGSIICDPNGRAVRLCGLLERIHVAAERQIQEEPEGAASLLDLLSAEPMSKLLSDIPELADKVQTVKDALEHSESVEVCGPRVQRRKGCSSAAEWWLNKDFTMPWSESPSGQYTGEQGFMEGVMGGDQSMMEYSWVCPSIDEVPLPPWLTVGHTGQGGGHATEFNAEAVAWYRSHATELNAEAVAWYPRDRQESRREWICATVAEVLAYPPQQVADYMEPDGSVPICHVFHVIPEFANKMYWNAEVPIRAILASSQVRVAADMARMTVRLRDWPEQACTACEKYMERKPTAKPVLLTELLMSPHVRDLFTLVAASSSDDSAAQLPRLREALAGSAVYEVVEEAPGIPLLVTRAPGEMLRETVEGILDAEPRSCAMLKREGEVPLSWILEQPQVRKMLERAKIPSGNAALDAVRSAVDASERYTLDGPRMSAHGTQPRPARAPGGDAWSPGSGRRQNRVVPLEKDARSLRELLKFYFAPFNLQYNRVLMSIIHKQRQQGGRAEHVGYLRGSGLRPVFRLGEISKLPRVSRLLEQYDQDAGSCLLAVALQTDEPIPIRMCAKREAGCPRGKWAMQDPRLELTYMPNFRFVEASGMCPEVEPLISPEINPYAPVQALPAHAVCVVSFSVSSDLSHSQSPKHAQMLDGIMGGNGVDPGALMWDARQLKIKRQVLMHGPDMICIQGLQSIGFAERCSEWEPDWFSFDDEPASNHLVHLYRDLSKANYGVAFAPTLQQPDSAVVCFGNAIFWKRSRWQVEEVRSSHSSSVSVEFASRIEGPRMLVTSTKSAAVYYKDWGDDVSDVELSDALRSVHAKLVADASRTDSKLVWCGDFGVEPRTLLQGLASQDKATGRKTSWQSACATLLGEDPWTSVSKQTDGKAVDLVLHDGGLKVLAVLGGMPEKVDLAELLKSGYPSDHLPQLAVFVDAGPSTAPKSFQ